MNFLSQLRAWLDSIFARPGASPAAGSPFTPSPASAASSIRSQITQALNLPANATGILLAQAEDETGNFSGHAFLLTRSLFNRHVGNGVVGVPNSDGFWSGRVYVTSQGEHLRIYSSLDQSAQDMAQWLTEFPSVLAALRTGDANAYGVALDSVGFSTTPGYGATVAAIYARNYSNVA